MTRGGGSKQHSFYGVFGVWIDLLRMSGDYIGQWMEYGDSIQSVCFDPSSRDGGYRTITILSKLYVSLLER